MSNTDIPDPSYNPVDPWNQAWAEAETTAPPGVLTYCTLELIHPAFIDPVTGKQITVRAVAGTYDIQIFTLEDGAPVDSGQAVQFSPIPFSSERPKFEEGKLPECLIAIDNVARELAPYLENAVAAQKDLITIYREYLSSDTSEPAYGPIQFSMKNVRISGTQVIGTAIIDDLANRKFPYLVYTIEEFPNLTTGNT